MPQTIYMPESPWSKMVPQLVQMYAQGMMQQHFRGQEASEPPKEFAPKTGRTYRLSDGSIQTYMPGKQPPVGAVPLQYDPRYGKKSTAKGGAGQKPLTLPQMNKTITKLEDDKVKITNSGGLSDLTMAMFANQPKILQSLMKGDIKPALGEKDSQLKYYRSERERRFENWNKTIDKKVTPKVGQKAKPIDSKPPASEHSGQIIDDKVAKKSWKSDGTKWVEVPWGSN